MERISSNEWAQHALAAIPPEWIDPVVKETEPGWSVLEWGVGTGDHGIPLKLLGRRNFGADFARELVTKLTFNRPGLYEKLWVADWTEAWPMADKSMDCVFSSGLTEHFADGELIPIFKEHLRVAKKRIVHLAPNAKSPGYTSWRKAKEEAGTWEYGLEIPRPTYWHLWRQFRDQFGGSFREYSVGTQFGDADEKYLLVTVIDL